MKNILTALTGISCFISLTAQDIRTSRTTSYYTYVYKLSDQQAETVYEKGTYKVTDEYFGNLIDSFETHKAYRTDLPTGHYLYVNAIRNQLELEVESENNVEINILNNNHDLNILINDLKGKVVDNAKVKLGCKTIRYNPATLTYLLSRTNRKGLLEVTYMGHTNYFNLQADRNTDGFKYTTNKILYNTPVKIVAIPVRLAFYAPLNTYQLFTRGRANGIYYYAWKPVGDIIKSLRYHNPHGYIQSIANIFTYKGKVYEGYFVFNKPKFKPGDTVFFKALITTDKLKPLKDSLRVEIYTDKRQTLGWIKPYRAGSYTFQFVADRNLGMKLDRDYSISLLRSNETVMSGSFRFEDYELKSTKYDFRSTKSVYHYTEPVSLYCEGTDENGLTLPDARVELIVLKEKIGEYYSNRVFVPDTLWKHKQNLDALGETKIIIPDSIFPAASVSVKAEASFLNSNNELQVRSVLFTKDNAHKEIVFTLNDDSLFIDFRKNAKPTSVSAILEIPDYLAKQNITLPYHIKINPFAYNYTVTADSIVKPYNITAENANLQCFTTRTADSVWFRIDNPRKVPVTYTVFRNNKPIYRGTGDNPRFTCCAKVKHGYSASVQYVWAGEVKTDEYVIPFRDKLLTIKAYQPSVIYPGQKAKISLSVTDAKGKPLPNADITALSSTKKFPNHSIPEIKDFSRKYAGRVAFSNFEYNDDFEQLEGTRKLNYAKWNKTFGLDSVEFYKFLYPKDGIYQTTFKRSDNTFAEIAPFLVDSIGNLMPVNILYIDNEPVYFSITTNPKPYVFRVYGGRHSIRFRTLQKEVEVSIYANYGSKTVLSVNPFSPNPKITVVKKPYYYTYTEKNILQNSTLALRSSNRDPFSYLQQGNYFEILKPAASYYKTQNIVGPIKQASLSYNRPDWFSISTSFEPGFEYEFQPNLVKMRSWNVVSAKKVFPEHEAPSESFNDSVYTLEDINEITNQQRNNIQRNKTVYDNPIFTPQNRGLLCVDYNRGNYHYAKQSKSILLLSHKIANFIRVYPGSTTSIHDLAPGYYRLLTILNNNSYIQVDSILIQPNGTNFCRFTDKNIQPPNNYIDSINAMIQKRIFIDSKISEFQYSYEQEQKRMRELAEKSRVISFNSGQFLTGKITDASTNETLPGVCIVIEGTANGTITDVDGNFRLEVPVGAYSVTVSYLGYKPEKLLLNSGADIQLSLTEDVRMLQEVVVVGYGTRNDGYLSIASREMSSSVVRVGEALQGRVAGVDIIMNSGSAERINIRGLSTIQANSNMLYVIDGIPQLGPDPKLNPDDFANIEIIKDASAVAIYGSRAANGAVIITSKKKSGNSAMKEMLQNKAFMDGVNQSKSLRNRFSDYAFWKPDLTTDNNGIASFEVTFPDDITAWNTWYLATGNKGAGGQLSGEIKSFKPIASSLALPRFLIAGDKSNIIGKALNYTEDSISVTTRFTINDTLTYQKQGNIFTSRIDTLQLIAQPSDSVKIKYQLEKADGYADGEERFIPIFPLGILETKGSFYNLQSDTTIALQFNPALGKITLHAESDIIQIMLDELKRMRNYGHFCNEQLSSKLKCMIQERTIYKLMGKEYKFDKDIRKIIRLLEERRNSDSLWGWWQNGPTCLWITLQVAEAIKTAEKHGFNSTLNLITLAPKIYSQFHILGYRDQMRSVKLLKLIDTVPDYRKLLDTIEIYRFDSVGRYEYWELRQLCGLPFPVDSLRREQKTTLFGNTYWGTEGYSLFDDAVSASLLAYRILRKNNLNDPLLPKIRNYLLERRNNMQWRNTWETSRILETILPDLITNKELNLKPEVKLTGGTSETITTFPFHKEIKTSDTIFVTKKSNAPVYFTAYQQIFNPKPEKISKDFQVNSRFENYDLMLKAGKPVKLIVNVQVKKASEYVMIEIPIPAGCSYQDKNNFVRGEDYREYFKEKVSVYCSRLSAGNHTFEVNLLSRFNGFYHLNPARAELMYFPVFFGREGMKKVKIE